MPLAEKSGISLFLPETYDIVWSLVILVVIAVCFYKYVMPKFQAVFDARAAKIEGRMAQAEKAQKDADEAKKKYEDQLSQARVEASKIRDDALHHDLKDMLDCHRRNIEQANGLLRQRG